MPELLDETILLLRRYNINIERLANEIDSDVMRKIHRNIALLMELDTSIIPHEDINTLYDFILLYNNHYPNQPSQYLSYSIFNRFQ
ncbi:hypothetical protein [Aliarcobacter cryaerophilus]|jgi:hypothetical protein|uniref:hypothetical protein n=1 Tax=Aliarcobacter cryaerophilus TaxID=28198 RepID=UPI003DA35E22